MAQYDIVGLGESLIDFVTVQGGKPGAITMEGNAGGGPPNVLAMAAKLGRKAALISKVGKDPFGDFIRETVKNAGVDTAGICAGPQPTTLAMVTLDATGNRSFTFYRNQTADVTLEQREVDLGIVENCAIFHFSTVSMAAQPARDTTLYAARKAKAAGAKLSFDPNYRPFLWDDPAAATAAIEAGLELADYVKMSDEEAELVTGEKDPEKAALALSSRHRLAFTAVTLGPKGCVGASQTARVLAPSYDVKTVDTTGAGDAFWGAVLHRLLAAGAAALDEDQMRDVLCFGNAAGSLATTAYGAIAPQPDEKAIHRCMKDVRQLL